MANEIVTALEAMFQAGSAVDKPLAETVGEAIQDYIGGLVPRGASLLANNAVLTLDLAALVGPGTTTAHLVLSTPDSTRGGLVYVNVNSGETNVIAGGASLSDSATDTVLVAGPTGGTDGHLNVAAEAEGDVTIKNRSGDPMVVAWQILAPF